MDLVKHLVIILNEHSRKGRKVSESLSKILSLYPLTYECHKTQYPGHAAELAAQLSVSLPASSRLIVVGGDGTLNEAISGLEKIDSMVPLGYLPAGSGNDFARSHSLPLDPAQAVKQLIGLAHPKPLDILSISDGNSAKYALNSFGIGLDGMVNYSLEQSKKKDRLGNFSYFITILSAYFKQKAFAVSLSFDGRSARFSEALLAVCVNHKYFGGGIPIHPKAVPSDGLIDIVVAEKVNFLELIILLTRVVVNQSHLSHKKLHAFRASACDITIHPSQYGQTDGEWMEIDGQSSIKTKKRLFWID